MVRGAWGLRCGSRAAPLRWRVPQRAMAAAAANRCCCQAQPVKGSYKAQYTCAVLLQVRSLPAEAFDSRGSEAGDSV